MLHPEENTVKLNDLILLLCLRQNTINGILPFKISDTKVITFVVIKTVQAMLYFVIREHWMGRSGLFLDRFQDLVLQLENREI